MTRINTQAPPPAPTSQALQPQRASGPARGITARQGATAVATGGLAAAGLAAGALVVAGTTASALTLGVPALVGALAGLLRQYLSSRNAMTGQEADLKATAAQTAIQRANGEAELRLCIDQLNQEASVFRAADRELRRTQLLVTAQARRLQLRVAQGRGFVLPPVGAVSQGLQPVALARENLRTAWFWGGYYRQQLEYQAQLRSTTLPGESLQTLASELSTLQSWCRAVVDTPSTVTLQLLMFETYEAAFQARDAEKHKSSSSPFVYALRKPKEG